MPPPPFVTSLDQVATGYTVFESDQVLTHTQLNSVAEYADDQIRLSRTRLSGVGVACGLRASLAGTQVRVTGGVGVTTDGDLLYLDADTVYDRYVVYDQTYPAYPPLYQGGNVNGTMFAAYELVPVGVANPTARALSQFNAATGQPLSRMTAVLLMESYRQDDDLCSGTDCDNLGARAVNTRKLLLVGPDAVAALRGGAATPAQAYGGLPEVFAERPALPATLTSATGMANAYRTACTAINTRLADALPRIFPVAGGVLGDVVSAASGAAWLARLAAYRNTFFGGAADGIPDAPGVQYYYDFLKDVVEAYTEFRERLFDDQTWCSPPITSFPKHLLLGDLAADPSDANRTGFYPSPVTSRTAGELDHARFLLQRLDALITHFQVSTANTLTVRVTPSVTESRPLEERAIPFYYAAGGENPIHLRWSWRLSRRGTEATAYGYHASTSWAAANTPAATPLAYQIGRYDFFRVEGVVGKQVDEALEDVQALITGRNLPFVVRAVQLGAEFTPVNPRPRPITDLHHLHSIVRKDTQARLSDAGTFSTHYRTSVVTADTQGRLFHAEEVAARDAVLGTTESASLAVGTHTSTASTFLGGTYAQYSPGATTVQENVASAIEAAASLSATVQPVAAIGYFTPLDNLAAGTQTAWLPWLDDVIQWKEEKEDQKLLFHNFAAEHPQLEHLGGVPRGGTLVLVHDDDGLVVAELTLPYACPEPVVEQEEPVLTAVQPLPPAVVTPPVRAVPTTKLTWQHEWEFHQPELDVVFQAKADLDAWKATESAYLREQVTWQNEFIQTQSVAMQTDLVTSMSSSYDTLINNQWAAMSSATERYTAPRTVTATTATQDGIKTFDDRMLGVMVEETRVREEKVNVLTEMALADPGDTLVAQQLEQAQLELGRTIEETTTYLVQSGAEVALGNEAYVAVQQMSKGMATLSGTTALQPTLTNIDSTLASGATSSVDMAVKAAMPKMR
ncbi:MAG TPA: hypothetical protein VEQ60_19505 [Longimicrobium sp.]|nr:hypothetical protein [Longimicrobium sp.]